MNFEIKDNVVHFKVEGSALSFATKESRQEFDVGEQKEEQFDVKGTAIEFVPDLSYSSGTSPVPAYTGQYTVIPSATNQQVLNTGGYRMTDNVTVTKIQYAEVSNTYGTTVSIATS